MRNGYVSGNSGASFQALEGMSSKKHAELTLNLKQDSSTFKLSFYTAKGISPTLTLPISYTGHLPHTLLKRLRGPCARSVQTLVGVLAVCCRKKDKEREQKREGAVTLQKPEVKQKAAKAYWRVSRE